MSTRTKPKKQRLDLLLVERGIAETRQRAQALILAGQVLVNQQKVEKAGAQVDGGAAIDVLGEALPYASRAGGKLAGALDDFGVNPSGRICLDVGSSTGGFTDCLLQRGAAKVYAVDVNVAQMAWKLQQDARVVTIEHNARSLSTKNLPEPASLVTLDLSFISVAKVLPAVVACAARGADLLILIKPQFELDRGDVGKGGIVRDSRLHQKAIDRVEAAARASRLAVQGVLPSRVVGAEGNQEFFLHARRPA